MITKCIIEVEKKKKNASTSNNQKIVHGRAEFGHKI